MAKIQQKNDSRNPIQILIAIYNHSK